MVEFKGGVRHPYEYVVSGAPLQACASSRPSGHLDILLAAQGASAAGTPRKGELNAA